MSSQAHLVELERRHRALDRELAEFVSHPSADDAEIAELKRRKLVLKDKIASMKAQKTGVH